jgi:hypothetical protein
MVHIVPLLLTSIVISPAAELASQLLCTHEQLGCVVVCPGVFVSLASSPPHAVSRQKSGIRIRKNFIKGLVI